MKFSEFYLYVVLTVFLSLPANVSAQRVERKITKDFPYDKNTSLSVDTKFGEVNILEGEGKSVIVEATIWVTSDNERLAEELQQEMEAKITESEGTISVSSVYPERIPSRNNTKFGIDFTIHAPPSITLELEHRYGPLYIERITGYSTIHLSYGTLKIQELLHGKDQPINNLQLDYSTGSISEAGWLKLNLSFSRLSIGEATAVVSLSRYSGLTVDECSSLVADSKYDTYKVGEMKNYVGDLRYSNLTADEVASKLEVESSYSTVKIGEIGSSFESVKIDNNRGSYRLGVSSASAFTIEGEAHRGDIQVNGMDNLNKRIENDDKYIYGSYGTNPHGKMNITSKEGSVKIIIE